MDGATVLKVSRATHRARRRAAAVVVAAVVVAAVVVAAVVVDRTAHDEEQRLESVPRGRG